MRLKPKTVRRLLLLAVVAILLAGSAVAFVVVRNARNEARLVAKRASGLEAAHAGDHAKVVSELGGYLRRRPTDPEALLAWARARRYVESRDGKHMVEASSAYQRYLGMRDDDRAARLELLTCLVNTGMDVEVIDVARRLRPAKLEEITRDDLPVVREEIDAHRRRREYLDATIALSARAVQVAPDDFGMRIRHASLLAAAKRNREAADFLTDSAEAYPDDPRLELIRIATGEAAHMSGAETLKTLGTIVGVDVQTATRTGPPLDDSDVVLSMVVTGFDMLGRADLMLLAMEPRARAGDVDLVRTFARRAVYAGAFSRLIDLQASLDAVSGWTLPEVLAMTAVSLSASGRAADADAMFARIEKSPPDFRTRSWGMAKDVLLATTTPAPLEAIKTLRAAIEENPIEPMFRVRLASILLDIGRAEESRAELASAAKSPLSEGWARIGVLRARSFLAEDRLIEAQREAVETVRRFPADAAANALMLAMRIENFERGLPQSGGAQPISERLKPTLEALQGPESAAIPPELRIIVVTGIAVAADRTGDEEIARDAVELALATDTIFPAQSLSRLVGVSRRRSFGLEKQLVEHAERGGPTPASTLVRAILLDGESRSAEARALIAAEVAKPENTDNTEWRTLLPRFLDAVSDPAAAKAWQETLTRFPDDIEAHRFALQSRAVARDVALVNTFADRLETLAGTRGERAPLVVRLARARALASADDIGANRDQVLGLLRAIVNEAPDLVEPRLLLVDAIMAGGPVSTATPATAEAITQLQSAIPLAANAAPVRLRLAEIHRQVGNSDAARAELVTVANDDKSDMDSRWAAIDGLVVLGQFEQAADISRRLLPDTLESVATERALHVARVFTIAGKEADAGRVYTALSDPKRVLTPAETLQVASGLASAGQVDQADALFDRPTTDAAIKRDMQRMRAQLARALNNGKNARDILTALIQSEPADTASRRLLVETLIADNDFDAASAAIEDARKAGSVDPDLELLAMQVQYRAGNASAGELAPLADVLDQKPEFRERAKAVRAYAALKDKPTPPTIPDLVALAAAFPDEATLQSVIIADLLRMVPPAVPAAAEVSLKASRRFPLRWQSAADVVRVQTMVGNWNAVLDAAERWQRLNRSPEADLAIGEAQLRLNRLRPARTAVQPHVAPALQNPDKSVYTLRLWSAILIADRQIDEARRLLEPMIRSSESVLNEVWIRLAAEDIPPQSAPAWLQEAASPAAGYGPTSNFALANAWIQLALRDPEKAASHRAQALEILEKIAKDTSDPAPLITLGQLAGEMNDFDRATSAFVAASKFPAAKGEALRGVAIIELLRKKDPAAMLAAARAAVEASGPADPYSKQILGDALIASIDSAADAAAAQRAAAEAVAAYQSSLAISGDVPFVLDRLANAHKLAGKPELAIESYGRFLALPDSVISSQQRAATQNNLAYLLLAKGDRASLTRARELVNAAAVALPVGAVFDTMGTVEAALGNQAAAIDAFRRSLQDRPEVVDTASKLAEALSTGTDEQKSEARQLVNQVEATIAKSSRPVSVEATARLKRVRGSLGMN